MQRRALPALLACSLVFSGCSRASAPPPIEERVPAVAASAAPASTAPAFAAKGGSAAPTAADGRMVVSEATLSLRAAHPEQEADALGHYVADAGGYVASREAERNDDVVKNVHMVVRVPAARFEAALGELRRHGTVLTESATGQDVTEDYADTGAQLRSKRKLEERLLHIVEGSGSVKDMLEVENELTRVRTDIERLEGHSHFLENRVAFATIVATFESPVQPVAVAAESIASRLKNTFSEAGNVSLHVTMGMIMLLAGAAPLAVPACGVLLVLRRRRRLVAARAAE